MPNWCSNTLTVRGPEADIKAFQLQASYMTARDPEERTELCLQKLYPCPPVLLNKELRSGATRNENGDMDMMAALEKLAVEPDNIDADDWYSWQVRNWGTKWDIKCEDTYDEHFKNGNSKIVYRFDTAWNPPANAFKHISEDWPTLTFKLTYDEPGNGVKGTDVFYRPELAV